MRTRSLTATLALAFAGTTLVVFALVGSFVYFELDRQVKVQDDLDIVLAARHTRRLVQELETLADVRSHAERLTSQVFGNVAMSMVVRDAAQQVLLEHNAASMVEPGWPPTRPIAALQRITENQIVEWRTREGDARTWHCDRRRAARSFARHGDRLAQHERPLAAA
jgi:two-component system heavy metal sensor histidine kinase CusS